MLYRLQGQQHGQASKADRGRASGCREGEDMKKRENMKKVYFLSAFLWCLLVLAACGKEEEEPHYYEIKVESGQLEEMEKDQFLLGQQYYQGEPVSILAEPSGAEGAENAIDVYIRPMGGDKQLLLSGVSRQYRTRGWCLDDQGRCYILQPAGVVRLDADGKLLYSSKMTEVIQDTCCLEGGRLILLTVKDSVSRIWELDPDTGEITQMEQLSQREGTISIGASGKNLVFLDNRGFWQVDMKKGTKELELPFIGTLYAFDGGRPADFWLDGSEAGILSNTGRVERLERVEITGEKEIIIVRGKCARYLKRQMDLFNQSNDTYYAVLEEPGEGTDSSDFYTETNLKLASGKGADIICSSAVDRDVSGLIEKGVFADLAPMMKASGIREEDYFQTAFDAWRENEKIYGIVPNVSLYSFSLDQEVLKGSGELTIETLVDAMLEFEGDRVFMSSADGVWILEYFLQGSENLWGMVDWEEGTCDFSGELFSKMLRAAKRYAVDERHQYPEIVDYRWCNSLYNIDSPKQLEAKKRADLGVFFDDGHHANSNIVNGIAIGINAESGHMEGAWELLAFLLGEEAQSMINYQAGVFPVNRNAFEQLIQYEFEMMNAVKEIEVDGTIRTMPANKRFGQEFTEEQAEETRRLLAGTETLPYKIKPLLAIIKEETAYYFDGAKDMEEVIRLVQNRVQLYLNEHVKKK